VKILLIAGMMFVDLSQYSMSVLVAKVFQSLVGRVTSRLEVSVLGLQILNSMRQLIVPTAKFVEFNMVR
jgi:hypothetical protein